VAIFFFLPSSKNAPAVLSFSSFGIFPNFSVKWSQVTLFLSDDEPPSPLSGEGGFFSVRQLSRHSRSTPRPARPSLFFCRQRFLRGPGDSGRGTTFFSGTFPFFNVDGASFFSSGPLQKGLASPLLLCGKELSSFPQRLPPPPLRWKDKRTHSFV